MNAPEMRKAAADGQAAFQNAQNDTKQVTALKDIKQRIKRLIVRMALWGLLPISLAEWLIHRGGMRNA